MSRILTSPGSEAAVHMGCTCPVMDNAYGSGIVWDDGPIYWVNSSCPLHGQNDYDEESDVQEV